MIYIQLSGTSLRTLAEQEIWDMDESLIARRTAGAIYVILALLWAAIFALLAINMLPLNTTRFSVGTDSSTFILVTLGVYSVLSGVMAGLLLSRLSFQPLVRKAILGLAILPMPFALFLPIDLLGAVLHLVPFFFVFKFYKDYRPPSPAAEVRQLRRVK